MPEPAVFPDRDAILARQRERESSARTYSRWLDIVPVSANGASVVGANGRRYLDCLSGAGTLALGHNHPEIVRTLRRTLDSGAPLHSLDFATPEKDDFINTLFETLPAEFLARRPRIQFCGPTGADAAEAAIKLCQTATGRPGVAAFTGAYHGMSLGALAVSAGVAAKSAVSGLAADIARLPYPYPLRCPFGLGDQTGDSAATYIERLLSDPIGGTVKPAALILEPVQGEGGVIPAPAGWLTKIADIAHRNEIPLVFDEIQSGVGRTGTFWAYEADDSAIPDVMLISKAIGGGLPLSVIVYSDKLDAWRPGAHAGTFRGNVLAMVAGAKTMRIVVRDGLVARAAELGSRMSATLRTSLDRHPTVAEVRGRGLMLGVELTDPTTEPDRLGVHASAPSLAASVRHNCLERGLILEIGGRDDSVLRLLPPLTISDREADLALEIVCESLAVAAHDLGMD